MTDSEDDLLRSNDTYSLQNEASRIYTKNANNTYMSSAGYRNNFLALSTRLPNRNFDQPRYGNMNYGQRRVYYGREMSPMSMHSMRDVGSRTYYRPYTARSHTGYQRSIHNGRSGSPASIRSIESNASVIATNIILAFENINFDNHDLRLIKEAYNKLFKSKIRKKIEKRRKMKLLLKRKKWHSSEDSGDEGSNSSINSDACRSTMTKTTAFCNKNISTHQSAKINPRDLRKSMNNSNIFIDCSETVKQNYWRDMLNNDPSLTQNKNHEKVPKTQLGTMEKGSLMKERFKKGFLLPSHRFNKSTHGPSFSDIPSSNNSHYKQVTNKDNLSVNDLCSNMDSEQEEIFSEISTFERNTQGVNDRKRNIDVDVLPCNPTKKYKVTNSKKQIQISKGSDKNSFLSNTKNDFIFAKPQMPIIKSGNAKTKNLNPEILISKSSHPITHTDESMCNRLSPVKDKIAQSPKQLAANNKLDKALTDESLNPSHSNDDISMRPSFIKRKLFTQRLDVTENKNLNDASQCSPIIKNHMNNKEKNKTRKLASTQSCLSRDDLEDNSVLKLIQKIVHKNNRTQADPDDKWDVSSIISNCNDNNVSDTFTDEEIFMPKKNGDYGGNDKSRGNSKIQSKLTANCKIVLEKLPVDFKTVTRQSNLMNKQSIANKFKGFNQKTAQTFWDTDSESEKENNHNPKNNKKNCEKFQSSGAKSTTPLISKHATAVKHSLKDLELKNACTMEKKKKTSKLKKNVSPVSKQNISNSNISIRTLRSNTSAKDLDYKQKPNETLKTVTLISHRMGRTGRLGKTEITNTLESPSPKETNVSTEFNISINSLRSRQRKNITNEKLLARVVKTRNRSGVKGI